MSVVLVWICKNQYVPVLFLCMVMRTKEKGSDTALWGMWVILEQKKWANKIKRTWFEWAHDIATLQRENQVKSTTFFWLLLCLWLDLVQRRGAIDDSLCFLLSVCLSLYLYICKLVSLSIRQSVCLSPSISFFYCRLVDFSSRMSSLVAPNYLPPNSRWRTWQSLVNWSILRILNNPIKNP